MHICAPRNIHEVITYLATLRVSPVACFFALSIAFSVAAGSILRGGGVVETRDDEGKWKRSRLHFFLITAYLMLLRKSQ